MRIYEGAVKYGERYEPRKFFLRPPRGPHMSHFGQQKASTYAYNDMLQNWQPLIDGWFQYYFVIVGWVFWPVKTVSHILCWRGRTTLLHPSIHPSDFKKYPLKPDVSWGHNVFQGARLPRPPSSPRTYYDHYVHITLVKAIYLRNPWSKFGRGHP